jgi:hypothetical protein
LVVLVDVPADVPAHAGGHGRRHARQNPHEERALNTALSSGAARESFERFRRLAPAARDALDGREREWCAKGESHVLRLAGMLAFPGVVDGGRTQAVEAHTKMLRFSAHPKDVEAEP